ncbi:MAG: fibronectin type III domain-containing protein, partial [Muribaculaceae bacterium]|nr:fibronectin type III domain-containing protein [Muribaculaceae bacterium]
PDTIAASELADGNSVEVTVDFVPQAEGEFNSTLNIASEGVESKTIALSGVAEYNVIAPVARRLIMVGSDFINPSWSYCPGATSYTLRVTPKESVAQLFIPTCILTENFGGCTKAITDFSTLDNYTDNAGWGDIRVYVENGGLRIGSKNAGTLTSPALDLTGSNGKVSVKFKAKAYNNDTNCQLTVGWGTSTQTVDVNSIEAEYTAVLDCDAAAGQTIEFKNVGQNRRVVLTHVEIFTGDVNNPMAQQSSEKIYTGITKTSYKVTGLQKNSTYYYDVKAIYGDKESDWSNRVSVKTVRTLTRLDDIIKHGDLGNGFKFKDSLIIVHLDPHFGRVWCKDRGNSAVNATVKKDNQIDYMRDVAREQTAEWDQSNWIMLQFPEDDGSNGIEELLTGAEGKIIAPETLSAYYIDNVNYTFEVLPEEDGYKLTLLDGENYEKNHYCTANFLEANLNINGGMGAIDNTGAKEVYYFFMNPKVQEVCEITHAKFDKTGMYVVPDNNMFKGGFKVDWSYNADGPQVPEANMVYSFTAVVNRIAAGNDQPKAAPARPASGYIVYPLDLIADNGTMTDINDVDASREVTGISYVNIAGQVSDKPFEGVNIVITRYSDGSSTVSKSLCK